MTADDRWASEGMICPSSIPHQHQLVAFVYMSDKLLCCLLYLFYLQYMKIIAATCGRRWTWPEVQLGCMIGGVWVTMPRDADEFPPSVELSRPLFGLSEHSVINLHYRGFIQ
jgi:hypothetical protein